MTISTTTSTAVLASSNTPIAAIEARADGPGAHGALEPPARPPDPRDERRELAIVTRRRPRRTARGRNRRRTRCVAPLIAAAVISAACGRISWSRRPCVTSVGTVMPAKALRTASGSVDQPASASRTQNGMVKLKATASMKSSVVRLLLVAGAQERDVGGDAPGKVARRVRRKGLRRRAERCSDPRSGASKGN